MKRKQKLGILVGEHGNWTFFNEIYDSLCKNYKTTVFRERKFEIPFLYGRLNRWSFRSGVKSILRQNDVCFFEWASELLVAATHMPKTCRIVTRLHSYELYAWAPKVNWDAVDTVILVSEAMRDKFCNLYPAHEAKCVVVYNGVSLKKFRPEVRKEFDLTLGMACSINPRKRVYEVVMMLDALRARGYDARLKIVGPRLHGLEMDQYYIALTRLIEKLNLSHAVDLEGRRDDVERWMEEIDIFISNSYWEGQQVALLEAMACGRHCLSHYWDGAEEVLPADNLYGVDSELLERVVDHIKAPDAEKQRRTTRMRELAEKHFDIERTMSEIEAIIEHSAVAGSGHPASKDDFVAAKPSVAS